MDHPHPPTTEAKSPNSHVVQQRAKQYIRLQWHGLGLLLILGASGHIGHHQEHERQYAAEFRVVFRLGHELQLHNLEGFRRLLVWQLLQLCGGPCNCPSE